MASWQRIYIYRIEDLNLFYGPKPVPVPVYGKPLDKNKKPGSVPVSCNLRGLNWIQISLKLFWRPADDRVNRMHVGLS